MVQRIVAVCGVFVEAGSTSMQPLMISTSFSGTPALISFVPQAGDSEARFPRIQADWIHRSGVGDDSSLRQTPEMFWRTTEFAWYALPQARKPRITPACNWTNICKVSYNLAGGLCSIQMTYLDLCRPICEEMSEPRVQF